MMHGRKNIKIVHFYLVARFIYLTNLVESSSLKLAAKIKRR
jgi:hypothetical protein